MIGREDQVRDYRVRAIVFIFLVGCLLSCLLSRLVYLQVIKGEELKKFSESNRLKKTRLFPTRGVIYDRNGKVIVDNRASFDVVLLAQYYPFTDEINERLAKALNVSIEDLLKKINKYKKGSHFHPVLIKPDVSKDVIAAIEMDEKGFPGVDIEASIQRRYPYADLASQVLGYIGEVDNKEIQKNLKLGLTPGDYIGKAGIEKQHDLDLRGLNGVGYVEVDARGRRKLADVESGKLLGYVTQTDPTAGNNLHLTLDIDLEEVAMKALKSRNFTGAVAAIDPRNGEILAIVNEPSYNASLISAREVESKIWQTLTQNNLKPLRNRTIQDHYPPGSTFKLLIALAGLSEGIVNEKTTINCPGHMQFGKRRFHCWKKHGSVDFLKSIKESCDVFYYQLGIQLGVDRIAKYARLLGFGQPTKIKLNGEASGLIPDSEWKLKRFKVPWQPGETLSVSIGQGYVDVTPLQLLVSYATIGNGGFVYKPFFVRRIENGAHEVLQEFQPELQRKVEIKPEIFELLRKSLYQVVNEAGGTAVRSQSLYTKIAGKTGTAQVRAFTNIMKKKCEELDLLDRHHGLFVGFAPSDKPEIAVVAVAEHACHGSTAGPIVKDVIDAYFKKYHPEIIPEEPKKAAPLIAKKEAKKAKVSEATDQEGDSVVLDPDFTPPSEEVAPEIVAPSPEVKAEE